MSQGASDPKKKADCYSDGERGWMELGQRVRATLLGPLLVALTRLGINSDAVTVFAGVVGLCFAPLWLLQYNVVAICCVWIHVLLDGVDGPVARYQGTASSRGSFTDTFTDQMVVTGVTIAWMLGAPTTANIAAGTMYVFFYAIVVAMAMVRNALSVPFSWLVRPRFFVYAAIAFDYFTNRNWTLVVLGVCVILLAIKTASGFLTLRKSLPGPTVDSEPVFEQERDSLQ